MEADNITVILNKLLALKLAKIIKVADIAKAIEEDAAQVSQWVVQRSRQPKANVAFKLQSFAAKMTLNISRKPALAVKYRAAFAAANVLFPVEGKD